MSVTITTSVTTRATSIATRQAKAWKITDRAAITRAVAAVRAHHDAVLDELGADELDHFWAYTAPGVAARAMGVR